MKIKQLLKKKHTTLTQLYKYLCKEFHIKFTYFAFINWVNGKKPMRDEYIWLLLTAIKQKFDIDLKITDLFPAERIAKLEEKFLRKVD